LIELRTGQPSFNLTFPVCGTQKTDILYTGCSGKMGILISNTVKDTALVKRAHLIVE